jgi:hypothetical protein
MSQSFSPPMPKTAAPVRYRNPVGLAVKALICAGVGLAGFLACNYLVVAMARSHVHAR